MWPTMRSDSITSISDGAICGIPFTMPMGMMANWLIIRYLRGAAARKFCSFVYSNGEWASPLRKQFFDLLSAYKRVDSGGRYMNNVGGPVEDKLAFQSEYKFCIAFENSVGEGYTTEKLVEAMMSGSIPVYWGDPSVAEEFNPGSFINVSDFGSLEEVVQEVVRLDNDDEAYLEMLNRPWVRPCDGAYDAVLHSGERLSAFLGDIVEHPVKYVVPGNRHCDNHENMYRTYALNLDLFDDTRKLAGLRPIYRLCGHYYRYFGRKLLHKFNRK